MNHNNVLYRSSMKWRWIVLVVATLGCDGKRRNPNVCCTTQADCAELGAAEEFQCNEGSICVNNACIEPETCQAESDCAAPTPYCAPDGVCGECVDSAQCGDLVCNEATHSCVECIAPKDCGNLVCDTTTHTCGPCSTNTDCESGFCEQATKTCRGTRIVPKFVPSACDQPGPASDLVISASVDFLNTDTGCNAGVVTQAGGPAICVVHYRSITISAGSRLLVDGSRALALVADDSLTIEGTLDISATGSLSGPGGGFAISGGTPIGPMFGGGGAGFATAGGAGGDTNTTGGASNGGVALPLDNVVLAGGPRSAPGSNGQSGGGGGAATLISCSARVAVSGVIDAGGGGGIGGYLRVQTNTFNGGSGGGAGGNVVLQGMNILVTGQLFANGGGGGAGRPNVVDGIAEPGEDALASVLAASGGGSATSVNTGGRGSATSALAGAGGPRGPGTFQQATPGGGGGGVGFLQTFTPAGISAQLGPVAISPDFSPGGNVPTK